MTLHGPRLTNPRSIITVAVALLSLFLRDIRGSLDAADCNRNNRADSEDIARRSSLDCNKNGIPDECDVLTAGRAASLCVLACDETKGTTLLDRSGWDRHGTLRGATLASKNAFGMANNGSIYFDARGDTLDLPAEPKTGFDGLTCISLSAFLLAENIEGLRYVLWGDDDVFSLRIRNGQMELVINETVAVSAPFAETGSWVHVCGVYDGVQGRIYKDGKLVGAGKAALGTIRALGSRRIVRVGNDETADLGSIDRAFRGYIDQIRIAGRALSVEEIAQDAFRPFVAGASSDCNANAIPDECDIAGNTSSDGNKNHVPDECEDLPLSTQAGLLALRSTSVEAPRVRLQDGIARFVSGRVPVQKGADLLDQAFEYLTRMKDLYGLTDPRSQLILSRVTKGLGDHLFFTQVHQGVPVLYSEIGVHLLNSQVHAASGRVATVQAEIQPTQRCWTSTATSNSTSPTPSPRWLTSSTAVPGTPSAMTAWPLRIARRVALREMPAPRCRG